MRKRGRSCRRGAGRFRNTSLSASLSADVGDAAAIAQLQQPRQGCCKSIKAAVTPARLSSHRRSPFAVDQHAAQDLAGGRLGDLLDELYSLFQKARRKRWQMTAQARCMNAWCSSGRRSQRIR
jgi:hypothetical protein